MHARCKLPKFMRNAMLNALLLLAGLLSFCNLASAQGLGEITLESALNEPLLATIELVNVAGLAEDQIDIRLATPDEFAQVDLEYTDLIARIAFAVELFPAGNGRITLTTTDKVDEPFLSLLISARWPTGRTLREYTVLLDLPVFAQNPASAGNVAVPALAPSATATGQSPANTPAASAGQNADSYTVQSGDTLWEIAEQVRPSEDVSVQQMMLALQRANEEAFINNNINRLLNGRVLRIPALQEITVVDHSIAVATIDSQNEALSQIRLGGGEPGATPAPARDELSVLTGDETQVVDVAGGDLEATIAALENALMLSEEDLDRARIENQELTSQLQALEEQIAIFEDIIRIEDERMARLQETLATQNETTNQALTEAGRAAELLAASQGTSQQDQGLLGMLENNLILIGVAFLVVLLVLAFLVMRARQSQHHEEEDDLAFMRERQTGSGKGATRAAAESGGFITALKSRFNRNQDDEDADDIEPTMDDLSWMKGTAIDVRNDAPGLQAGNKAGTADMPFSQSGFGLDQSAVSKPRAATVKDDVAFALQQIDDENIDDEDEAVDLETELEFEQEDAVEDEREYSEQHGIELATAVSDPISGDSAAYTNSASDNLEVFEFKLRQEDAADVENTEVTFDENDISFQDEEPESGHSAPGMDECDMKLDLAVAYAAMDNLKEAVEILGEIIAEGKPAQIAEAQRLLAEWQGS